jgi:hypothetical protein
VTYFCLCNGKKHTCHSCAWQAQPVPPQGRPSFQEWPPPCSNQPDAPSQQSRSSRALHRCASTCDPITVGRMQQRKCNAPLARSPPRGPSLC